MCDILHVYLLYRIGIFFPPFRRSGASVKNCQVKKIFFTVSENLHPIFLSFPSVTSLCWWLRWTSSTTPCGRSMLRLRGAPASLGKVAERERTRGRRGGSKVRARLKPCLSHAQKRSRGAGTKEPLLKFLPSQLARGEVVSSPPVFSPEASSSINPPPPLILSSLSRSLSPLPNWNPQRPLSAAKREARRREDRSFVRFPISPAADFRVLHAGE